MLGVDGVEVLARHCRGRIAQNPCRKQCFLEILGGSCTIPIPMVPTSPSPMLDDKAMWELGVLVGQESHTVAGQIAILQMIERMLRAENTDLECMHIEAGDGLYSLLLRLGDPRAPFKVFIPAHIDSVPPLPEWQDPYTLKQDPINPDRLRALGIGDMKAAAWLNLELARTIQVPKGAEYIFGWIPDEEKKSRGARTVIANFPDWEKITMILGSEIGSFRTPENDEGQRIVVGRRGVAKFDASISIASGGHADEESSPNAIEAYHQARGDLVRLFYGDATTPGLAYDHPMLGKERWQDWRMRSDSPEGALNPTRAEFGYRIHLVPPSTLDGVLEQQRECFRRIAAIGNWQKWRIDWNVVRNQTQISYPPYAVAEDHPLLTAVMGGAAEAASAWARPGVDVSPTLVDGPWSDENLYATERGEKVVIGLPYEMQNPHTPREHASRSSIARTLAVYRHLLERYFESNGVISQHHGNS